MELSQGLGTPETSLLMKILRHLYFGPLTIRKSLRQWGMSGEGQQSWEGAQVLRGAAEETRIVQSGGGLRETLLLSTVP